MVIDAAEGQGVGGGGVGKRQQPALWPRAKIVDDGINRLAPSQGGQGGGCGYEGQSYTSAVHAKDCTP